ncbi:diguanylate cyclase [Bosea sp. 117]|uniref:sensor domain-containing diguanylate cyclase n=1 Tax=Bosea sp. 117 TaxID=1125973 RepID=UPI0004947614|nr:diguanylate cyclase [Bosea sp. 117]
MKESGSRIADAAFLGKGRRVSLRTRLIVLVALGMILLVGERAASLWSERGERLELARQHVIELTDRGVSQYRQTLGTVRGVLQALTPDVGDFLTRPDSCGRLEQVTELTSEIGSLSVTDADGIVVCSTNPAAQMLDLSDREYVRIAQRGIFVLSSVVHNRLTGAPSVLAVQPAVNDEGDIEGLLIARVELELLFPLTAISEIDLDAAVLMLDPEGTLLMADKASSAMVGRNLSGTPLGAAMLGRSAGSFTAVGPDGETRIFGFTRLPEDNLRLAVGIDAAQTKAQIERATWRAAVFFLAACSLIFIGLWLAGERLVVQPIRYFAERLASFGSERPDTGPSPAKANRIVELEPLVDAFTAMERQLNQRESALRAANRRLDTLASRDPLTGVPNRRAFDRALDDRWRDVSGTLALLMVDVDSFKQFNDRYGHGEGDACLRRVASALAASVRSGDIVARIGGEEFAVLMPGADVNVASDVANRLRVTIENLDIRHEDNAQGRVTVSIGYAACSPSDAALHRLDLMQAADTGLYAAKAAGRNAARAGTVTPGHNVPRRSAG